MSGPTGYVVYQGPSKLDGSPIVGILTVSSKNAKTADMAQLWILRSDIHPSEAVRTGADSGICGDCVHRGELDSSGTYQDRSCYVLVFQGPRSVYEAYRRGRYPVITPTAAARIITGRPVRLGAYGDPAAVPLPILRKLIRRAPTHTGYTHQWETSKAERLRDVVMASVDTVAQANAATAAGWRYFRVATDGRTLPGEIICPASKEAGHLTTCNRCGLCNGSKGPDDKRKNIAILAHGALAVRFIRRMDDLERMSAHA